MLEHAGLGAGSIGGGGARSGQTLRTLRIGVDQKRQT